MRLLAFLLSMLTLAGLWPLIRMAPAPSSAALMGVGIRPATRRL